MHVRVQFCELLIENKGLDYPPSPKSWKTVLNKSRAENVGIRPFSNQQKIQLHFYRAHACFVKYFLMTKKLQQTKKLAYVTTCGPSGMVVFSICYL